MGRSLEHGFLSVVVLVKYHILFLVQTDTATGANMEHEAFKTEYQQMKKEKERLEKVGYLTSNHSRPFIQAVKWSNFYLTGIN